MAKMKMKRSKRRCGYLKKIGRRRWGGEVRVTVRWRELESNLAYIMPRTEHASNVPMPFGMSIFCVDATDCSANFYSGVEDVTVVTIDEEKKVVGGGEKIKMCSL